MPLLLSLARFVQAGGVMSRLICPLSPDARHEWRQEWDDIVAESGTVVFPHGFYCVYCLFLLTTPQAALWSEEMANGASS